MTGFEHVRRLEFTRFTEETNRALELTPHPANIVFEEHLLKSLKEEIEKYKKVMIDTNKIIREEGREEYDKILTESINQVLQKSYIILQIILQFEEELGDLFDMWQNTLYTLYVEMDIKVEFPSKEEIKAAAEEDLNIAVLQRVHEKNSYMFGAIHELN